MARRLIINVKTPLGDRVTLSRDRWRQITRFKHPAMATHLKAIRECLESPAAVRASVNDPDTHLYYAPVGPNHVCVVTGLGEGSQRFVVTAYFTAKIKEGVDLWKK